MNMDEKALEIVRSYIFRCLPENDNPLILNITWKAKVLQNWKYLISSNIKDWYFELTYNGNQKDWYLDAYKKVENVVVSE